MTKPPFVSVVIPTYSRLGFLGRALASVKSQTFDDYEIIVVDDGSSDGTSEFVRKLSDPRIRCLRHASNRGAPAARNTGCEAARGAWIAFLDSDDEWFPQKLEKQIRLLNDTTNSTAALVTCGWGREGRTIVPMSQGHDHERILRWDLPIITSTILARAEVLRKIGLFDVELPAYQEWDLTLRLSKDHQIAYVNDILVTIHRHQGARISRPRNHILALGKIIDKYHDSLRERPAILAQWYYKLSVLHLKDENIVACRAYLQRSLSYWPWSARRWASLAFAYVPTVFLRDATYRLYRTLVSATRTGRH